jgi:CXXX repeat peptide maturase
MPKPHSPFEYVLVVLENGSAPFCHYENAYYRSPAAPRWMGEKLLKAVVARAKKDGIALTFLLGATRPPANLEKIMASVAHVKIVPLTLDAKYPGAVVVASSEESTSFDTLKPDRARNLILRVARNDLKRLAELFGALEDKFGRLSIHLLGLEYFTGGDLKVYAGELEKIAARLKQMYAEGRKIEVNVLTDRMMLTAMRNCEAGEKHVTVAPDGRLYICPAFLCDGEAAIGAFDEKKGFAANPPSTVAFARAPLCTRCDAWHCKRCTWLNRKLTLEYNVPSEQQCLIAHAEREASRLALAAFGRLEPFRRLPHIVEIDYRDPLELIDRPPVTFAASSEDPML